MLMKNNKGQSALEYLMTYGWAVIAILVVIGLLYWLTSQQSSTQAQCGTGFPNIPITGNTLTATGLQLELSNGTGKSLTTVVVNGTFTQGATIKYASSASTSLASGTKGTVAINPAGGLLAGDVTADLNVTYNDGSFPQAGKGQCKGKI